MPKNMNLHHHPLVLPMVPIETYRPTIYPRRRKLPPKTDSIGPIVLRIDCASLRRRERVEIEEVSAHRIAVG
jgi:hypothetical protein